MLSKAVVGAVLAAIVTAQEGNDTAPFPNTTYPDAISPDPAAVAGAQSNQTSPPSYPSPWSSGAGDWKAAWQRAIEMVAQLTLEEKVNITTGTGWSLDDCVGNTGSVPRLGIRSLCMQDSPTGMRFGDFVSVFPSGVNVGATWDKGLAYARGVAMGEEFRGKGVNGFLGPVAGPIGRSPAGGRNWEGFSPDPYLTGALFAESIKGVQSTGQIAVGKHYIGNEQEHFRQVPEALQFGLGNITYPGSSNIDDVTLHELYAWPFADGVHAGLASIMCSYNRVNNSDGCQNSYLQNHVLKNELGFQGFILSDWQATHSGVSSILAGLDVTMPGDIVFNDARSYFGPNLTIAVLNGTVPQWRLDDMVTRVLAGWYYVDGDSEENNRPTNFNSWTKDTYGPIHSYVGAEYGTGLINEHIDVRAQHGALIRAIGSASTVLLKNVNNTLPLNGTEKLTSVFGDDAGPNLAGPNGCADRGCAQGTVAIGWGSGTADFPYLITPDAAIQREVTDRYGAYESILSNGALTQIQALARRTDDVGGVCIAFGASDSGEGYLAPGSNYGDRNNLTFWQGANEMLKNVTSNCNNTILVVHSVGAVEVEQYKDHPNVTAIVWAGLPGEQSGNSLADVLYGRINPGAKLPYTIGRNRSDYGTDVLYEPNGDVPQFDFQEGVFIDYRTFDHRDIEPVYEFGFGLSYTTFNYSNIEVQSTGAGPYVPQTGETAEAPTYGTIDMDPAAHLFPNGSFTRIPYFIYPYINSTDLEESYGHTDFGDNSFIPEGALDGSAQPVLPAGGAPGGNPSLWDVLYVVSVDITNTGDRAGDEVAQLYVSLGGQNDPKVVLRGFERVPIPAGETVTVRFDVKRRDLSNWDTVAQDWIVRTENTKKVYVGSSSRQLLLEADLDL
ncbi:Putative glycoside hydrolase, family 3, glycoside hydrolase family 3 domain, immunoglobulin [Septoria linicola]|uniref:beta-glucosidase n=1 Tax=Septoria linicola TaxID=215465 RepID=A0A9Q9B504_9PEZI|nr:putative glycoside hydrolase, family 3, glycoside hydrolase family 3 domain, immunoglobulin [Septoria linicola]USW57477.1 Putative glycoside hydrolase, family 3, glycoside hydrolase family 3 domain, immunoglobulin [Septoria linicola]